jgi:hypothetical protein
VSAQLKAVIDRCNCVTPVVVDAAGGTSFRRRGPRTRRGGLIVVVGPKDTLVYPHADVELGAVAREEAWLDRARALGAALAGPPLPIETGKGTA